MKKIVFLLIFLVCIVSVVAIDELIPNVGGSQADSIDIVPQKSESIASGLFGSSKLQTMLKEKAASVGNGKIPIIVLFDERLSNSQKNRISSFTPNIDHLYSLLPAAAFEIDISDLDSLAELSFVQSVEYDAETKIVLAQSTTQIGASRVWLGHGVEGEGVTIAVLDTGIDNEHPDVQNVIAEQDFTGEGTDDDQGHGTHVASTIAGSGVASGGVNKGVAPKATLMDVKVLDRTGSGKLSDTIAGIEWAVLNNADVISMSLGAQIPCNGLDATSLASDAAVKRGVHVVVAAGNTGPLPASIGSPGCARDVITVGAVDRLDTIAVFSSRGPTLDGRVKPDVVAPGVLIFAAKNGGGYTALSGTSMATPHVSGVVALIVSGKKGLLPDQVKNVIMSTAKDLGEDRNTQGAGRVNAYDAFIAATGVEPEDPPNEDSNEGSSPNSDSTSKKRAEEKSREDGYIDTVKRVDEKEYEGNQYYVVEGSKTDDPQKIVRVWVNQETGLIDRVEEMGFIARVWISVMDFIGFIKSLFV
jgi:serine protease AprX